MPSPRIFIAFALAALLAVPTSVGAQITPDRPMAMAPAVFGSTWTAIEINGEPAATRGSTFLVGDDNASASGNGGCNRWSSPVTIDGDAIKFGPIRATNMACLGPGLKQEKAYFAALGATRSLEAVPGELHFKDEAGTILIRFAI